MPRLPNLLIVGAQKSGTTWLHLNLKKSSNFFGSETKELNFFNRPDCHDRIAEYRENFAGSTDEKYVFESTPGYFQIEQNGVDVSRNIARILDHPKILVILRNPIERYESAIIHHMMRGRMPLARRINFVTGEYLALSLGFYGRILAHWRDTFPEMKIFFYDDLERSPPSFIQTVFRYLDVENDLDVEAVARKIHHRQRKAARHGVETRDLPRLTLPTWRQLADIYREDIERLSSLTGRDLSHWVVPPRELASPMARLRARFLD